MRKNELSYMNILFCLLVIFIHVTSYPLASYEQGSLPYSVFMLAWRAASFVVQGFILLSGLKMFLSKNKRSYTDMLLNKLKTIVIPYAFWFVIYYVFYIIIAEYPIDAKFIAKHFLLGSLTPHTYFVALIMQFFLLYPLWQVIVKRIPPLVAIPAAIIISVFAENYLPIIFYNSNISFAYNDRIFTTYLSYWLIGCYIGANYEKFNAYIKNKGHYISAFFVIFTVLNLVFSYINYNGIKYISHLNVIHAFYSLFTILFLFLLFNSFSKKSISDSKLFIAIDRSSYTIYLCHMLFVYTADYIITNILGLQSTILSYLTMIVIVYPLATAVSILVNRIKKRIRRSA